MRSIGALMVLLGAGSFALEFLNMEFFLLGWVNNWGADVGHSIRIALFVVGAVILLIGKPPADKPDAPPHA